MKKFMKFLVIVALLLLSTLFGCGKDSNPLVQPTTFTIDNFPHEIGTVWKYQYFYQSLASVVTDTVFVRIDGTTSISDDSLIVYVIISDHLKSFTRFINGRYVEITDIISDTTYWHIAGDTVTYYKNVFDSLTVTQKLIFPLEVGSIWTTETSMVDSNEVTGKSARAVLGKNYANSFEITRHSTNCTECYQYYSFVPNIGLIHSSEESPCIASEETGQK